MPLSRIEATSHRPQTSSAAPSPSQRNAPPVRTAPGSGASTSSASSVWQSATGKLSSLFRRDTKYHRLDDQQEQEAPDCKVDFDQIESGLANASDHATTGIVYKPATEAREHWDKHKDFAPVQQLLNTICRTGDEKTCKDALKNFFDVFKPPRREKSEQLRDAVFAKAAQLTGERKHTLLLSVAEWQRALPHTDTHTFAETVQKVYKLEAERGHENDRMELLDTFNKMLPKLAKLNGPNHLNLRREKALILSRTVLENLPPLTASSTSADCERYRQTINNVYFHPHRGQMEDPHTPKLESSVLEKLHQCDATARDRIFESLRDCGKTRGAVSKQAYGNGNLANYLQQQYSLKYPQSGTD